MPRLPALDPHATSGRTRTLLDGVQKKLGVTPNLMRTLANSTAALDGYLAFGGALAGGSFTARLREQIALTVAETNACSYCLSAHAAIGKGAGLDEQAILDARGAMSADPRTDAILKFAEVIVARRGMVDDQDLEAVRAAGVSDGEIAEVVANVAINVFTNYFNHVAGTEVDFPVVTPAGAAA